MLKSIGALLSANRVAGAHSGFSRAWRDVARRLFPRPGMERGDSSPIMSPLVWLAASPDVSSIRIRPRILGRTATSRCMVITRRISG